MELADETVTAAHQINPSLCSVCGIRKKGTRDGILRGGDASVGVRGLHRRSINDETEQQKRECARKHAMLLD